MLPRECPAPRYDADKYPDEYAKPLLPGVRAAAIAAGLEPPTVTNKLGWAYGFVTDTAVIHDAEDAVAISYTVWSCPDGVMNADRYGYKEIERFAARLGEVVWAGVKGR